ncbi:MAG: hypothetical protein CVV64_09510 [Candidatus Wallbacteria bacterium HGW-Wallbacteria-1]|jgi:hypothetical protein|uniref:Uncharacterized protein n=1 Tax=Candidatus Wallbacteria bacterium HGW-Wallbacteria-1 TaxID=2013854 RepID=A0A2N1PQI0_9BACT|nr:MAG: hypothetical protein CVV64_09510 [Candidatus Wallbacteria bacterium HGW-Wallbacteria-1]
MLICNKCGNSWEFDIKIISVRMVRATMDDFGNVGGVEVLQQDVHEEFTENVVYLCGVCGCGDISGDLPQTRAFRRELIPDLESQAEVTPFFPSEGFYVSIN